MGRRMKKGRYVNVNISIQAFDALERHCLESGQTKTVAIERAVLACYGSHLHDGAQDGGGDGKA